MPTNLTTIESYILQENNLLNSPSTSFSPFASDYLSDAATNDDAHDSLHLFSQLILNLPNGSRVAAQSLDLPTLKGYCGHAEVAGFAKVLLHLIYSTSQNQLVSTVIGQEKTDANEDVGIYSRTQVVLTLIFLVVGVLGVVGNWLTVLVICKTNSLHTPTNYLLASLACSDLFLILVGVPFDLFYLWTPHSAPAFHGFCELTSSSISWFTFNSILTIVALTVERLVAIRYPFKFRSWFHSKTVIGGIIGIWVSAFFPSLYIGLQFKPVLKDFCGNNHQLNNGLGSCDFVGWNSVHFEYTFEVMLLLTFVLPVLFIICCYVLILHTLNQVTSSIHLIHVQLTHRYSSTSAGTTTLEENNNNSSTRQRHLSTQLRSQKAHRTVLKMLVVPSSIWNNHLCCFSRVDSPHVDFVLFPLKLALAPVFRFQTKALQSVQITDSLCERNWSIRTVIHTKVRNKCHVFLRDGAANMKKAFEGKFEHADCRVHKLNTAVKTTLSSVRQEDPTEIEQCLTKCRKIVGHFSYSKLAKDRLREIQTDMKIETHRIKQDVPTILDSHLGLQIGISQMLLEEVRNANAKPVG